MLVMDHELVEWRRAAPGDQKTGDPSQKELAKLVYKCQGKPTDHEDPGNKRKCTE